jgi:uncharacterized repeat protein (TIGR03809 family)
MPTESPHVSVETIRKWHALAQRRCAYLVELHESGRWHRFFSEVTFQLAMQDAVRGAESWAKLLEGSSKSDGNALHDALEIDAANLGGSGPARGLARPPMRRPQCL